MRTSLALCGLLAVLAMPAAAIANTVNASLIPDGTYTVKVEKVQDSQHIVVQMNNGIETTLSAGSHTDFGKIKANDTVKVSVISGKVPVYAVL